jgi:hypothetical protein
MEERRGISPLRPAPAEIAGNAKSTRDCGRDDGGWAPVNQKKPTELIEVRKALRQRIRKWKRQNGKLKRENGKAKSCSATKRAGYSSGLRCTQSAPGELVEFTTVPFPLRQ